MKILFPYYRYLKLCKAKYAFGIIAGVINGAVSGFGMAFIAAKMLPVIFDGSPGMDWHLLGVVLLVPLLAILRGGSAYLSAYFMGYCDNLICLELRKELMAFMTKLSLSFYHKNRTGKIMARVLNDSARISSVVTRSSSDLIRQPVTILGAFAVMIYLAFQNNELYFLLIVLAILPICVYLIRTIGGRITSREKMMGNSEGSLNSLVHENIESARETRAFNLHAREAEKFRKKAERQFDISLRLLTYKQIISPSVEIVTSFGIAIAILYSALSGINLETVVPLLMALYVCYQPFKKLGTVYADLQRASLAARRLGKVYDSPEYLPITSTPQKVAPFKRELEFDNVSFGYRKGAKAIRNVTVTVRRGEIVALIGPSGAGKSTFCNLLCRFYDPKRGKIRFDGTDIQNFDENDYRQHIAIVPQDSFLFADTILNNIRVGCLDASDEEVIEAARKANADDFIRKFPDGYDTVVSERGASLSGGQRQRIAIARAFLRDAEILILDEATSAIDAESEQKIHAALDRLFINKTVFIIAHRHSTIRMAERILLFNEGVLELDGDKELLKTKSVFYRNLSMGTSFAPES